MRRAIFVLVFLLATGGVAWAGTEAYKLVMSKEDVVCKHLQALFNSDIKEHGAIQYQRHPEFNAIEWTTVWEDYCDVVQMGEFDINNDGHKDIVLRNAACLSNEENDILYVYDKGLNAPQYPPSFKLDAALAKRSSGMIGGFQKGSYYLKDIPKFRVGSYEGFHHLGAPFIIHPFIFQNKRYVTIDSPFLVKDGGGKKFLVIAKYKRGEELEDACYLEWGSKHPDRVQKSQQ